jgi:transposase-like protein
MSVCLICSHEKNREINYALLRGALVTVTAKKFGVPVQTLARHRRIHLRFKLRSARGKSQPPSTLEEKLAAIDADLQRLQLEAECSKGVANIDAALRVVKARQNLLELEAKIVGRMPDGGAGTSVTVNTGNAQPQQPTPTPEEMLRLAKEFIEDYEREHALYPGEIIVNAKPTE